MRRLLELGRRTASRRIRVATAYVTAAILTVTCSSAVEAQVTVATIAIPTVATTSATTLSSPVNPSTVAVPTTNGAVPEKTPVETSTSVTTPTAVSAPPIVTPASTTITDSTVLLPATVPATAPTTATAPSITTSSRLASTTASSRLPSTTRRATPTAATPTAAPAAATLTQLRVALDAALGTGAGTRSALVNMEGLGPVYERNADTALPPASVIKITTGGAALLRLGPDHRFVTSVWASTAPVVGTVRGDLIVRGAGDPSLTQADVGALAVDVAASVKSVSGDLVLDDRGFDAATKNPGWKDKFTPFEVGLLSSFMIAGNHRADSATLADPDLANLALIRNALTKAGVEITGGTRRGVATDSAVTIASHSSRGLGDLVAKMLKDSENTYAEQILRAVGGGSTTRGVQRIGATFGEADLRAPIQADGSGLSANDRATARQLVAWLRLIDRSPVSGAMRASLSVACGDGTLRSRLCATPADKRVWAKTGTLDYVHTIAGYGMTASGRTFTFAILLNNVPNGRVLIDQAIASVAGFIG